MFFLISFVSSAYYHQHEEKSFLSWMRETNQIYTGDEYRLRFGIFLTNSRYVKEVNSRQKKFKVTLNKYAALTPAEYKSKFGLIKTKKSLFSTKKTPKTNSDTLDWREKGIVNEIKDQGTCQSNYAFSLIQAIESKDGKSTGSLKRFSEQNIVDCSSLNFGCNGGNPAFAFQSLIDEQNGQVCFEKDYVYTGNFDDDCKFDKYDHYGSFLEALMVDENDEDDLASKIELYGPASVCIDASNASFQLYSSGIYDEPSCSIDNINHAVGCVGFGVEGNTKYWIVRNQWGTSWGEKGYMRMIWENNQCGIAFFSFVIQ